MQHATICIGVSEAEMDVWPQHCWVQWHCRSQAVSSQQSSLGGESQRPEADVWHPSWSWVLVAISKTTIVASM